MYYYFLLCLYEVNLLHFTFAFNLRSKPIEQSGGWNCGWKWICNDVVFKGYWM